MVTAKLISIFVFATQIVRSLYFLNPKFQASSHLPWFYSLVCVRPGREARRPLFSERGSYSKTCCKVYIFHVNWILSNKVRWQIWWKYNQTCLKRPLKNRLNEGLNDRWLLNAGLKYCRMLPRSILQYFWPALSDYQSWKSLLLSSFVWPFKTGLTVSTYCCNDIICVHGYMLYTCTSIVVYIFLSTKEKM